MSAATAIQYVPHRQINKQKWDDCISHAGNGLIYAYSWYLDHMSPGWDALVCGDYLLVMPLTWKRKYGIHYLYQPFLTAQLGVFGTGITKDIVTDFISVIPEKFKLAEISLNSGNRSDSPAFIQRVNYTLSLLPGYDALYSGYRENVKRNVKKAWQLGCTLKKDIPVADVMDLALQQIQHHGLDAGDGLKRFKDLYNLLQQQEMATTYGVTSAQNELIASCVFFFSHKRAYYILVGNHPNGKTIGASHALIDAFIKDHAGTNLLLDFEGSDIRNLAFFYSSFGASEELYPFYKMNRLPFYLRWLKKIK